MTTSNRWRAYAVLALIGSALTGCQNSPTVFVSTGTMVGLEAAPGLGDGPPLSVSLAYKRAEIALVPVCKEDSGATDTVEPASPPVTETKQPSEPSTHPAPQKPNAPTSNKDSTAVKKECHSRDTRSANAFSALATFQLAINWFGPAKIEQFIATGHAARNIVTPESKWKQREAAQKVEAEKMKARAATEKAEEELKKAKVEAEKAEEDLKKANAEAETRKVRENR